MDPSDAAAEPPHAQEQAQVFAREGQLRSILETIPYAMIHGHRGRIWAEPSKLGGTAFHFTSIDASGGEDG